MKINYQLMKKILTKIENDEYYLSDDLNEKYNYELLKEQGYVKEYSGLGIQLSWKGHEYLAQLTSYPQDILDNPDFILN